MQIKDDSAVYCENLPNPNWTEIIYPRRAANWYCQIYSSGWFTNVALSPVKKSIDTLPSVLGVKCQYRKWFSNWPRESNFDEGQMFQIFPLSFMIGMKLACQPHSKCVNKAWGLIIYYFTGYIALPVLFTRAQKYRKIPLENLHTCSKKTHSRVQGKLSA